MGPYLHLFENNANFGAISHCTLVALLNHEETAENEALSVMSYKNMIA